MSLAALWPTYNLWEDIWPQEVLGRRCVVVPWYYCLRAESRRCRSLPLLLPFSYLPSLLTTPVFFPFLNNPEKGTASSLKVSSITSRDKSLEFRKGCMGEEMGRVAPGLGWGLGRVAGRRAWSLGLSGSSEQKKLGNGLGQVISRWLQRVLAKIASKLASKTPGE